MACHQVEVDEIDLASKVRFEKEQQKYPENKGGPENQHDFGIWKITICSMTQIIISSNGAFSIVVLVYLEG